MIRGTPNWMAPESVKRLEYTRYSDIWSIGCLVIEMLTGEPPWSEYRNPMAVLFQLYNITNTPDIPQQFSPLCKNFIECCFQIDPTKRYNVKQLLEHPFLLINSTVRGSLAIRSKNINIKDLNTIYNKDDPNIVSNVGSCKENSNSNHIQQTTNSKTATDGSTSSNKSKSNNNFFCDNQKNSILSINYNRDSKNRKLYSSKIQDIEIRFNNTNS